MASDSDSLLTLVVHCLRLHAKPSLGGGEVHLDPKLSFLELCASLLNTGACDPHACATEGKRSENITFVESPLPGVVALGQLPAGYANGRPLPTLALLHVVEQLVLADSHDETDVARAHTEPFVGETDSTSMHDTSKTFSRDESLAARVVAQTAHIQEVMGRASDFCLWVHRPCFEKHTRLAMRRGAGTLTRAYINLYCWQRRRRTEHAMRHLMPDRIISDLVVLLAALEASLGDPSCFAPILARRLDIIVLVAHAQVILDIPEEVAPWGCELAGRAWLQKLVHAVRTSQRERGLTQATNESVGERSGTVPAASCGLRLRPKVMELLNQLCDDVAMNEEVPQTAHGKGIPTKSCVEGKRSVARSACLLGVRRATADGPVDSTDAGVGSRPAAGSAAPKDEHATRTETAPATVARWGQWRGDALMLAWLALSVGAFAIWNMRRRR
eukprot:TRINITY_DN30199_c0_g1_i1.p1 TRINITY_DN30199_c0_g1~~TRINITY_DN30199_c0_g1_i1.p1  ORF type:complete len:444 (-),score=62.34 TRINITY_DN30199_c0_g1_i1:21-1352(-)